MGHYERSSFNQKIIQITQNISLGIDNGYEDEKQKNI
jgi:hypothetical protein